MTPTRATPTISSEMMSRSQFHQHFTLVFFANILAPKNCKAKHNKRKASQFAFVQKMRM